MDKYISFKFTDESIAAVILAEESGETFEFSRDIPAEILTDLSDAESDLNFYSAWLKTDEYPEIYSFREAVLKDLQEFMAPHRLEIVGNLMIIPARQYMSLETGLPFNDPKIINRVIQQEVQDKVPFDLTNFKISYKVLGSDDEGLYNIHIGICPRSIIDFCEDLAKSLDLTVQHICTKADLLRAVSEDKHVINISADQKNIYLKAFVEGEPAGLNIVNKQNLKNQEAFLKSLVAYYKQRFATNFKLIETKEEQDLSLSAELLSKKQQQLLADFGNKNYLWNNFANFAKLASYQARYLIIAILLLIFVYPIIKIGLNNYLISKTENVISRNLTERVPQLSFPPGKELDYLMTQNAAIGQQLEKLGNPSSNNPFDVYAIIAEILDKATSANTQMDLQDLKISGDKIVFSGTVPIYKGVDRIERLLKNRENLFCQINKETPGSSGSNTRFIFRLRLCA